MHIILWSIKRSRNINLSFVAVWICNKFPTPRSAICLSDPTAHFSSDTQNHEVHGLKPCIHMAYSELLLAISKHTQKITVWTNKFQFTILKIRPFWDNSPYQPSSMVRSRSLSTQRLKAKEQPLRSPGAGASGQGSTQGLGGTAGGLRKIRWRWRAPDGTGE